MSHHLTETLSRQVSYQPCPKPPTALPSYQSCPKPPSSLTPYQPCPPPKPPGLPGCSSLLDDASSSAYSTEVKVTDESGGVIKSLSFQPEPLQTKMERADGYDYRYAYANTYRYDDYWGRKQWYKNKFKQRYKRCYKNKRWSKAHDTIKGTTYMVLSKWHHHQFLQVAL